MTPREHLEASLKHYESSGNTAENWVKMPGFKFACSVRDNDDAVSECTTKLLFLSDEELNEKWARWQIEREEE